jgi:hypothetical protein
MSEEEAVKTTPAQEIIAYLAGVLILGVLAGKYALQRKVTSFFVLCTQGRVLNALLIFNQLLTTFEYT